MTDMTLAPLSRIAGPTALAAGVLMVVAELMMWPFDPSQHVVTTTDPVFQIGGVLYLLGFCLLLLALPAAYAWQAHAAGTFGVVGVLAAMVGTFLLGGDLWFETFAVPWLADEVPQAFDTTPTTVLALGAFSAYGTFALGWALFGLASLRARVFPAAICIALVVGGVVGWNALLAPYGAVLGLGVACLGAWMTWATTAGVEVTRHKAPPVIAHGAP
jgi:hypothetical protein